MKILILLFLTLSPYLSSQEKYDAVKMNGVKVALLSECKVIKPKDTFTVAVHLQHFDGFHTYWKNPGMVGFPTQLKWSLPPGFKVGKTQWQVPERAKMLKYNCHGYKKETFLLVDITAPAEIPESISLKVNIGGMSCSAKSCCSIGFADSALTIKRGPVTIFNKANQKMIASARDRLPKPLKGFASSINKVAQHMTLSVKSLSLTQKKEVYFFPDQNIYDTEVEQEISYSKGHLQVKFKLNNYVPKDLKIVSGLLYCAAGWGNAKTKYLPISCKLEL